MQDPKRGCRAPNSALQIERWWAFESFKFSIIGGLKSDCFSDAFDQQSIFDKRAMSRVLVGR
jgi:hypothetical protein